MISISIDFTEEAWNCHLLARGLFGLKNIGYALCTVGLLKAQLWHWPRK
jgi:hypothetical protein